MIKPHKLEQKVVDIFNESIVKEYEASHAYKAKENWCRNVGYEKAAEHYAKESADELTHAQMLMNYLVDWNVTPEVPELTSPQTEFKSLAEVIDTDYSMEYELLEFYEKEGKVIFDTDLCSFALVQKLLNIQVVSVAECSTRINILEGVEPTKFNLLLLENNLF